MSVLDKLKEAIGQGDEPKLDPLPPLDMPRQPATFAPVSSTPPGESPVVKWIHEQLDEGRTKSDISDDLRSSGYTAEQVGDSLRQAGILNSPEPMQRTPFPMNVQSYSPTADSAEVESLIDERIHKVHEQLDKFTTWSDRINGDIDTLKAQIEQMTELIKKDRDMERVKFKEYDRHLSEVKVELKATQEVFKKGLPQFTKGIQELNRIVKTAVPRQKTE
jgi:hypothetical protein